MEALLALIRANKQDKGGGIYSVCSAHPQVLMAALAQAKQDGSQLLIEATANQVNQYGGYTGMQPADFIDFVVLPTQLDSELSAILESISEEFTVVSSNENWQLLKHN